jgi:cobalamin biosynthesis Mg chelatase CobN
MQGAPRRSARSFFVLPLVLALLAFVALPNFASAGEVPQYETENTESFKVPNSTKEPAKPKHNSKESSGKTNEAKAHASENTEGGGTSPEEESEGSEKEKSQTGGTATGNGGGNGGNGGGGESSKSGGNGGKTNDGIGGSEAVAGGGTGTPVAHKTESSGGSSPVVPILIAVIVLAAISIGVVLYRQRKSGGQGPDRSVSSPNAS